MAYEAVRIATKYMIPVIVLSDSYLANGSEPFRIPSPNELPEIKVQFRTDPNGFYPYLRDPKTLARPWAIPGTPGLEHLIGGLEKDSLTGCVSYDADNHEKMVFTRQEKIARVQQDIPGVEVLGNPDSEVALVGWGSTFGAIAQSVDELNRSGIPVAQVHLSYLNPLPGNLGEVLKRFKKVIVPEINLGQLSRILRATYLIETIPFNRVLGVPIRAQEGVEFVHQVFEGVVA
jgi:2-oxoglutarate ferredoxin oxidoreductase subunit alpha